MSAFTTFNHLTLETITRTVSGRGKKEIVTGKAEHCTILKLHDYLSGKPKRIYSLARLHSNDQLEDESFHNILNTLVSVNIRHLGINLTNDALDIYSKNYKILLKITKEGLNK